jgi:hypothetical protein
MTQEPPSRLHLDEQTLQLQELSLLEEAFHQVQICTHLFHA